MSNRSLKFRAARVVRALDAGYAVAAVVRLHAEDESFVLRVQEARRSARGLLSRGAKPKVVYANYCDLLPRDVCGL